MIHIFRRPSCHSATSQENISFVSVLTNSKKAGKEHVASTYVSDSGVLQNY